MNARKAIGKGRDRTIARILGAKEEEIDPFLPEDKQEDLREIILDELNYYAEFCMDIVGSVDDGTVILNEEWVQKIDELHEAVIGGNVRST